LSLILFLDLKHNKNQYMNKQLPQLSMKLSTVLNESFSHNQTSIIKTYTMQGHTRNKF